jgi:hypothetical protein
MIKIIIKKNKTININKKSNKIMKNRMKNNKI